MLSAHLLRISPSFRLGSARPASALLIVSWCGADTCLTDGTRVQVAHFLEADVQPWTNVLAAAVIADELQASDHAVAGPTHGHTGTAQWQEPLRRRLDDLAPLGDTVDAVLRAAHLPLAEQLVWTPAKWQPAVISSHIDTSGTLTLHASEAAACCNVMHAVRGIRTLILRFTSSSDADARDYQGARLSDVEAASWKAESESACAAVAALPSLQALRITDCHRCPYGAVVMQSLAPALRHLSRLQALALVNSFGNGAAAALAPSLGLLTTLNSLVLGNLNINADGAAALALALQALTALTELSLLRNDFGAAGVAPALSRLSLLQVLDLTDCTPGEEGMQALAPALSHLSRLKELKLTRSYIGTRGAAALALSLSHLTSLTMLGLLDNRLFAEGAQALAPGLSHLSSLQVLQLADNNVGYSYGGGGVHAVTALAPSLALLTELTELWFMGNGLGVAGSLSLAPALGRLSQLQSLELAANDIGADGAAALAPHLGLLTALRMLDPSTNSIGDAGVLHLVPALIRLTALDGAFLERLNDVSAAGVAAFRASVPASVWKVTDLTS